MSKIEQGIGIALFESENFGGWKVNKDGLSPTLRANKQSGGVIEIRKVDKMYARDTIVEQASKQCT